MKLKVIKLNESTDKAWLALEQTIPGTSLVTSIRGWHEVLPNSLEVGDTFEVPDTLKLGTRISTAVDKDTGEELNFTWFEFLPA